MESNMEITKAWGGGVLYGVPTTIKFIRVYLESPEPTATASFAKMYDPWG